MGRRAFVWLGGMLFAVSLTACAWCYLVVMGRQARFGGWLPLVADAVLLTIFASHHSLFARDAVKAMVARIIPLQLVRSFYVWVASLLLLIVSVGWWRIGGQLYTATGALAIAGGLVQLGGLCVTARGVARIDPLELAGIRPARENEGLRVSGPYRWVRHPVYLGWVLMTFGAAHMTGDRLAFAMLTTAYLVAAIPWEERSLRRSFGEDYARYMRQVRWRMIPFIY